MSVSADGGLQVHENPSTTNEGPGQKEQLPNTTTTKRGFGGFTRHYWSKLPKKDYNSLAWVNISSNHIDPRHTKPTQAKKFVKNPIPASMVPSYWVPVPETPLKFFSRAAEEERLYASFPATRCEEWSSLRQMLPSKGYHKGSQPPKWGTSGDITPINYRSRPHQYRDVNSLMTK